MENANSLSLNSNLILKDLLENVDELIKDSDAIHEKEIVKKFINTLSSNLELLFIGKTGSGKTSFISRLFHDETIKQENLFHTVGIHEQKIVSDIIVYDIEGIDTLEEAIKRKVSEIANRCAVLFVVFSADNVKEHKVWEFIENVHAERVVFVQTKCDLYDAEVILENKRKIENYMSECKINAPVFCVFERQSPDEEFEDTGYDLLRSYLVENGIGSCTTEILYKDNINRISRLLMELENSFEIRKQQYYTDEKVLKKINYVIDEFREKNHDVVEHLKTELKSVIEYQIEEYQNEIIRKLDPRKIRERFPKGSNDFIDYMNFVNETYRCRMTEQVNRKMQDSVRDYLGQLEIVFQEVTGYFKTRESLLMLEDKFYGTLADSKNLMLRQTTRDLEEVSSYCRTLSNASEEFFMKMWNSRNQYDNNVMGSKIVGGSTGAAVGAVGTQFFLTKLVGATVTGLWPVVGALVGAMLIATIAKMIMSAKSEEDMIRKVNDAIAVFRDEVYKTKCEMTERILSTVEQIFKNELDAADKMFLDFRISVNIDSAKIPVMEEKLNIAQGLLKQLEEMEEAG